jgi:hypothetical protein
MPSLSEIKAQIKQRKWGMDILGKSQEVRCLPDILQSKEEILKLTSGFVDDQSYLIVLTTQRMIFLSKGFWSKKPAKVVEMSISKISSVESKTGLLWGEIHLVTEASKISIKKLTRDQVKPLSVALNRLLHGSEDQSVTNISKPDITQSIEIFCSYKGGFPGCPDAFNGRLRCIDKGVEAISSIRGRSLLLIPWEAIKEVSTASELEQTSSAFGDIASGIGLISLSANNSIMANQGAQGLITYGANQKSTKKHHFLLIKYEIKNITGTAVFELEAGWFFNKNPSERAVSVINDYRIKQAA